MKNIVRIIFCLLLPCHCSFLVAQRQVDLALKSGISIPNLTAGNAVNPVSSGYRSRLGFDAAVAVEWHLSGTFSLQPQLEYSQQGGKKNGVQAFTVPQELAADFPPGQAPPYLYASYNSTAKMNYLMLPILAKLRQNHGKHWQSYIGVGPFVSCLLSAYNVTRGASLVYLDANQRQPLSADVLPFDSNDDVKESLHAFNAGISGQIGLAYRLYSSSVFVEGGGNYGFVNIQKDTGNGSNRTGAAVISLGYQFTLW